MTIAVLLLVIISGGVCGVIHPKNRYPSPDSGKQSALKKSLSVVQVKEEPGPGGIWQTKTQWKPHWVKHWETRKIWVPVWRKIWGPVQVNEWIPLPKTPPTWEPPTTWSPPLH